MSKNPVTDAFIMDETITISIVDRNGNRNDFHLDSAVFLKNLLTMAEMKHDEGGTFTMPFTTWYVDDEGNKLLVSRGH